MIGKQDRDQQTLFIAGDLAGLVPNDHILKRVHKVLDLCWLRQAVAGSYCLDNGRPGIDPEAAVRLMLAGFFAGIKEDRKLMREAQVNLAIRWFAGYRLDEGLPHHSSQTRIRQRWGEELFRKIFTRTVDACLKAGLVNGETVHIDATLIRADVSWESLTKKHAEHVWEANGPEPPSADEEGPPAAGTAEGKTKSEPKKTSPTDPDATLTTSRHNYPMEPAYKQHTVSDDRAGVIVDVAVTTGEASEGRRLLETVERVEAATGVAVRTVTADAAYAHSTNYAALEQRSIQAVIPPQPQRPRGTHLPSLRFKYDARRDVVRFLLRGVPGNHCSGDAVQFHFGSETMTLGPGDVRAVGKRGRFLRFATHTPAPHPPIPGERGQSTPPNRPPVESPFSSFPPGSAFSIVIPQLPPQPI
jgi:transposase